ncbi:hypothetical protein JCM8547_004139 [Rhodosporidiobolus lusitaniae]
MADDAAVLAEIARLSSAIEQHKTAPSQSSRPFYAPRGRGGFRGRGRGGRGGSSSSSRTTTIPHCNATWVAPGLTPSSAALGGSRSGTTTPVESSFSGASGSRPTTPAPSLKPSLASVNCSTRFDAPVEKVSLQVASGGTTPVRRAVEALDFSEGGGKGKAVQRGVEREVVIDGVVFVADVRGRKLVRRPEAVPSTFSTLPTDSPAPDSPSTNTPKRASHLGTTYIRTKSGNLVSLAFARKRKEREEALRAAAGGASVTGRGGRGGARGGRGRGRGRGAFAASAPRRAKPVKPKSDKLCRFFQRTGQCTRAHTCPYVHDSNKVSICPLFLRSSCPRTSSTCPLSHTPNAHRSPHCQHFPSCTRGSSCPYAHVVVSKDAPVCRDFGEYGWCEKGETCDMRHVRECWRFAETGKCEVKGCREPHVLRRKHEESSSDEDDEEEIGEEAEDAEEESAGTAPATKRKRESHDVGISGAAGRRLAKKLKKRTTGDGFGGEEDFVQLTVQLSDEDDDEDEDEMSVDSDDLDEEEEEDGEHEGELLAATSDSSQQQVPADPFALSNTTLASAKPRKSQTASYLGDPDELDYGLSSSDDDADDVEQLLRR